MVFPFPQIRKRWSSSQPTINGPQVAEGRSVIRPDPIMGFYNQHTFALSTPHCPFPQFHPETRAYMAGHEDVATLRLPMAKEDALRKVKTEWTTRGMRAQGHEETLAWLRTGDPGALERLQQARDAAADKVRKAPRESSFSSSYSGNKKKVATLPPLRVDELAIYPGLDGQDIPPPSPAESDITDVDNRAPWSPYELDMEYTPLASDPDAEGLTDMTNSYGEVWGNDNSLAVHPAASMAREERHVRAESRLGSYLDTGDSDNESADEEDDDIWEDEDGAASLESLDSEEWKECEVITAEVVPLPSFQVGKASVVDARSPPSTKTTFGSLDQVFVREEPPPKYETSPPGESDIWVRRSRSRNASRGRHITSPWGHYHYKSDRGEYVLDEIKRFLCLEPDMTAAVVLINLLKWWPKIRRLFPLKKPRLAKEASNIEWRGIEDDVDELDHEGKEYDRIMLAMFVKSRLGLFDRWDEQAPPPPPPYEPASVPIPESNPEPTLESTSRSDSDCAILEDGDEEDFGDFAATESPSVAVEPPSEAVDPFSELFPEGEPASVADDDEQTMKAGDDQTIKEDDDKENAPEATLQVIAEEQQKQRFTPLRPAPTPPVQLTTPAPAPEFSPAVRGYRHRTWKPPGKSGLGNVISADA
ncbi:hypothetical protein QBC46DRAFT_336595 [Diplogelasinospora grovesii]|uniref:Uncharacterized protein n=1 Tax=Diplogelasinospora grovesii TaxID=303347 RepID=A0AAN6NHL7_9PEZI|nr:hypothetical protein QBC46DRAFT_336595 [Diplogelasinospora grovesii]